MLFLFECCLEKGKKETGIISSKQIANRVKTSVGSIEETIRRLKKNEKCIWTVDAFKWRNGGAKYRLSDDAYESILRFKQTTQQPPNNHPTTTQQKTQQKTQQTLLVVVGRVDVSYFITRPKYRQRQAYLHNFF